MKIGKKNVCLKKNMEKLKNENESLNGKITCLEVENKALHYQMRNLASHMSIQNNIKIN